MPGRGAGRKTRTRRALAVVADTGQWSGRGVRRPTPARLDLSATLVPPVGPLRAEIRLCCPSWRTGAEFQRGPRSVPACGVALTTSGRAHAAGGALKAGQGSLRVRPSCDNPTNPDIRAYAAEAGGSALRVIIHMPTRPRSVPACGGTAIIPRRTHAAGWSPESRAGARIARGEIRLCCPGWRIGASSQERPDQSRPAEACEIPQAERMRPARALKPGMGLM